MSQARLRRISIANTGQRISGPSRVHVQALRRSIIKTQKSVLRVRQSRFRPNAFSFENEDIDLPFIFPEKTKNSIATNADAPTQIYHNSHGRLIWSDWDWVVTTLGFTVNVTTMVRFPFLCASYGGGAFIIMSLLMVLLLAVPCCFMESIVGQFTRTGGLAAWKISPLFKGIGFCFLLINFLSPLFSNTMTTWSISYLIAVFSSVFGEAQHDYIWARCNETWNSQKCIPFNSVRRIGPSPHDSNSEFFRGFILGQRNLSKAYGFRDIEFGSSMVQPASTLLGLTLVNFLVACLVGAKGLPRISIIIFGTASSFIWLLVTRTISLPGAIDGVHYFLDADWNQMGNFEAWLEAARYVFSTYGLGVGIHLTHASYNEFRAPILLNLLMPIGVSVLYAIFCAIAIFSLFGFSAQINDRDLSKLIKIGPELVFEFIPIALDYDLSFPTHFYFGIIFLAIFLMSIMDSIVRIMHVKLSIQDLFATPAERRRCKWIILPVLMVTSYGLNLPLISTAAQSWIQIYEIALNNVAVPFLIFMEMVAICWIYGPRALDEAHMRCTEGPILFPFQICWKILTPILVLIILIAGMCGSSSVPTSSKVVHPTAAHIVGIGLVALMLSVIVIIAILTFLKYKEQIPHRLKFLVLVSPDYEKENIEVEEDGVRAHWSHYLTFGFNFSKRSQPADLIADVGRGRSLDLMGVVTPEDALNFIEESPDSLIGEGEIIEFRDLENPSPPESKEAAAASNKSPQASAPPSKLPAQSKSSKVVKLPRPPPSPKTALKKGPPPPPPDA